MLTENAAGFLRDFGVPCVCGAVSFTAILNKPDEVLTAVGVNLTSTMYVLECATADVAAAAIATGSTLTANGQPFVVRDVLSVDDGLFTHLTLSV